MRHGFGVWKSSQNTYAGFFKDNKRHGNAINVQLHTQDTFMGRYENDEAHGNGMIQMGMLKEKYLGEWKKGEFSGHGAYYHNDNSVYLGSFEHDVKKGQGVLMASDGKYYKVEAINDKITNKTLI